MLVKNLLSKNEINYKNFENTRFTPFNEKILKTFEKISKRILSDKKLIEKKIFLLLDFGVDVKGNFEKKILQK